MKYCKRCGISKPATTEFFYKNSQTMDKLHAYCKTCKSAIHKKYMQEPEIAIKVKKRIREWQIGIGKEKYKISRKKYDKSEKRRAWRHERTKKAKEFAEKYIKFISQKEI